MRYLSSVVRQPVVWAFSFVAFVVFVAACGGGGDGDSADGGSTGSGSFSKDCQKSDEKQFDSPPELIIDTSKTYVATITMEKGDIVIELPALSVPAISPDGQQIAYVHAQPDAETMEQRSHIEVVPFDGGAARRLTAGPRDGSPVWSPDGATVAFLRPPEEGKPAQVWLIETAGGEARRLSDLRGGVARRQRPGDHFRRQLTLLRIAIPPETPTHRPQRDRSGQCRAHPCLMQGQPECCDRRAIRIGGLESKGAHLYEGRSQGTFPANAPVFLISSGTPFTHGATSLRRAFCTALGRRTCDGFPLRFGSSMILLRCERSNVSLMHLLGTLARLRRVLWFAARRLLFEVHEDLRA